MTDTTLDTFALEQKARTFEAGLREPLQRFARAWQLALAKRIVAGAPEQGGKLRKALDGGAGAIREFHLDAGGMTFTYGIDSDLVAYARVQDEGGVIKPKHAKALTVPVSETARKAIEAAGGSVRNMDVFLLPGTNVLVDKRTGLAIAVLKQSVTIKGTHYFERGVDAVVSGELPAMVEGLETDLATLWNAL